ncbi:hypothetical protein D3C73_1301430 [compost metagenome]
MSDDQGGTVQLGDGLRDRERLPRSRCTEQCLVPLAFLHSLHQFDDCLRLITLWGKFRLQLERLVTHEDLAHDLFRHLPL